DPCRADPARGDGNGRRGVIPRRFDIYTPWAAKLRELRTGIWRHPIEIKSLFIFQPPALVRPTCEHPDQASILRPVTSTRPSTMGLLLLPPHLGMQRYSTACHL